MEKSNFAAVKTLWEKCMKNSRFIWHAWNYLKYIVLSGHRRAYGIHSPFLFDLITRVFNDRTSYEEYKIIERLRNKKPDRNGLMISKDPGAGTGFGHVYPGGTRSHLLRISAGRKTGRLLFRLARYFRPSSLLELGTGYGLSTLYLALGAGECSFTSLEGIPTLAEKARENLQREGAGFVRVITGMFEDTLPPVLKDIPGPDMVYFDGNHREEATLKYFETCLLHCRGNAVLVFDDIYWSRGMTRAWKKICLHPRVSLSIDLFQTGLVFLNRGLSKEHYRIRF